MPTRPASSPIRMPPGDTLTPRQGQTARWYVAPIRRIDLTDPARPGLHQLSASQAPPPRTGTRGKGRSHRYRPGRGDHRRPGTGPPHDVPYTANPGARVAGGRAPGLVPAVPRP